MLHRHWNLLPSVWDTAGCSPDSIRRVAALCQATHAVGDAFSIVDSHPSVVDTDAGFRDLLALPGVYVITLDQCAFGASFRGRSLIITNQAWVFQLTADCNSPASHSVWEPSSQGLSYPARNAWAQAFASFLNGAESDLCPHCAVLHGTKAHCSGSRAPPEPLRRVLFREFEAQFPNLEAVQCELTDFCCTERSEGVLTVRVNRLGARWYPRKQKFIKKFTNYEMGLAHKCTPWKQITHCKVVL